MNWLNALPKNRRRGSLPRCLLLMDDPNRSVVADRLNQLVNIPGVTISEEDTWTPKGIPIRRPDGTWDTSLIKEVQLDKAPELLDQSVRNELSKWWFAVARNSYSPNWDIGSTCKIGDAKGLVLIEAKAHPRELSDECKGKLLKNGASKDSEKNHFRIGECIRDANGPLSKSTGHQWKLSRDSHYQMANRFAWACKLTELGIPVVLMYLGFLNAKEMEDRGQPIASENEWRKLVTAHSHELFPDEVWDQPLTLHGQAFFPIIRSIDVKLPVCTCQE